MVVKPYPTGYIMPKFQRFNGRKAYTREHVICFLDFMGAHAHDTDLCLRDFQSSCLAEHTVGMLT